MDSSKTRWANFRTGEIDWLDQTPTDCRDYITQDDYAQSMYKVMIRLGKTPQDAWLGVMKACVGEPEHCV